MNIESLLRLLDGELVFASGLLAASSNDQAYTQLQLSRWVKGGKVIQLRRGLYVLGSAYRKTEPHPFVIANRLQQPSYVSLQSALSFYGLIPEYVPTVTSITTRRPCTETNHFGRFSYRCIKQSAFCGYHTIEVAPNQFAFLATPEKALLDALYLTAGSDNAEQMEELRLQNLKSINWKELERQAKGFGNQKLYRCLKLLKQSFDR